MTPTTTAIDRVVTLLMGVLLVALGLLAIDWAATDVIGLPATTATDAVLDLGESAWWPWALGAVGVVLILLGLRWLVAHLRSAHVSEITLPGSSSAGRLRVNARAAASASGLALADTPGVSSATGRLNRDRGQLVMDLRADLTPDADLHEVARACDATAAALARILHRRDLHCRVHLSVRTRGTARERVH